jgi:uncharacterized MAPEG superfamily protein
MPFILWVLFIVTFLPMLLAMLGGYCRYKQFGKFDNHYPRLQQAHMSGLGARVLAAQQNAWEALMMFSAMTLLAYTSGLNLQEFSYAAGLFLLSRLFHPLFYILDMDTYRSLVFMIGLFSCIYIGVKAITAF